MTTTSHKSVARRAKVSEAEESYVRVAKIEYRRLETKGDDDGGDGIIRPHKKCREVVSHSTAAALV